MRTFLTATAVVLATGAVANAATLDFLADANASERGVASGTVINSIFTGFTNVTLSANDGFSPYFDKGNAGLGVCKVLTASAQCNPSDDDNVTISEMLTIAFDTAMNLSNMVFTGEGHSSAAGIEPLTTTETLLFAINGGTLAQYTFADLSAASFTNVLSASFHYDDGASTAEQFYLASADVTPVPLPAALPMLAAAMGGLGFLARRRRKAA